MEKEMKDRIHAMARRTWEVIGGDILQLFECQSVSKNTVIETVCDADYMMFHGGDKEAYKEWRKLDGWNEKMKAVEGAFTHSRYGW